MSYLKYRVDGNLWVIVEQLDDGAHKVSVIDAKRHEVEDERERAKAIVAALREESRRRSALWNALPDDVKKAIREERA